MPSPSMPLSVRNRNVTTGRLRPASSGMLASGSSSGMASVVASKPVIFMVVSLCLWLVQFGTRAGDGAYSPFEHNQRCGIFRHRLLRGQGVDHDDIGRIAHRNAVVLPVYQSGGAFGQHGKALPQPLRLADLTNIGLQIGHPDQRAVAKRCERIEDVVGGN